MAAKSAVNQGGYRNGVRGEPLTGTVCAARKTDAMESLSAPKSNMVA